MRGPTRRVIYEAADYREAIELVQQGINAIAAAAPILDAIATAPAFDDTQAEGLLAAGRIISDLAADLGTRARILTSIAGGA